MFFFWFIFYHQEGVSLVMPSCNRRYSCINDQLNTNSGYGCSSNAVCEIRNGDLGCFCNEWFRGDGESCSRYGPKDCYELYNSGVRSDGTYTIYPSGTSGFQAYCDMSNGGWTVSL